ncbi:glycosyl transferase [Vibrio cyclitrophicus]
MNFIRGASALVVMLRQLKNINKTISRCNQKSILEGLALNSTESLIDPANKNLVVSLTTYNKRVKDVFLVIESLGRQTKKAGKIILWLDKQEFDSDNLPLILKSQVSRGLTIKFCDNLKSYKKLLPTIDCFYDANIITVDDDVLYPYYFIENLLLESTRYPDTVVCYRAHKMLRDANGNIQPYKMWEHKTSITEPGFDIFPTGIGGVLYPPGVLHKKCLDYNQALQLAPNADDVWFKAMTTMAGNKSKLVSQYFNYDEDFIDLIDAQDIALNASNVQGGENDIQINKVYEYYDIKL